MDAQRTEEGRPERSGRVSWFLGPRSIALLGATERSLWSAALVANFRDCGYPGELHLVNPRAAEVFGRPCHPDLDAVPGDVEHAYVLTGTAAALDVVEDCGRRGVRHVTMLTSGFRETGPEGAGLEAFMAVADRALAAGKPLVVLKVGRGEATARSVAAHTGSLAGADAVVDAAFRQHGVVRVRSVEELLETCALLAARGWPGGPR